MDEMDTRTELKASSEAEPLNSTATETTTQPAKAPTGRLVVRQARPADLSTVIALARSFHEESHFSDIEFSEDKATNLALATMADGQPQILGLVAEIDGQIKGFLLAQIGDYFVGQGAKILTILAFYIESETRKTLLGGKAAIKLIKSAQAFAKHIQADHLLLHATSGIEVAQTNELLQRLGFKVIGGNYVE